MQHIDCNDIVVNMIHSAQKYIKQVERARITQLGSKLKRRHGESAYQRGQREIKEQAEKLKTKIDNEVIQKLKKKNWFEQFISSITKN